MLTDAHFSLSSPGATPVSVGDGCAPILIAGPCVIESRDHILRHAEQIAKIAAASKFPLIFKSSFDKANRTSGTSFRGHGRDEGLKILEEVRLSLGLPVISDVHSVEDVVASASSLDVLQIPAFLSRQTDLVQAAANTGKPVMIKKGQFLPPEDMRFSIEKVVATGNRRALACERGSCFGYRELIVDFRSLETMRGFAPVIFDATHSVQSMGGAGGASSGSRHFVPLLARAAAAVGVDGFFIECHEAPEKAPSDGPNMLPLTALSGLLNDLRALATLQLETRAAR